MNKPPKATFTKGVVRTFAYKVEGLEAGFHLRGESVLIDSRHKIDAFKATAKRTHVDAKGRATLAAVKEWVKFFQPTQFFASWTSDSSNFKDDSVELWYTEKDHEQATA